VLLARSYKALGRFELAADAYSHLGIAIDGEPDLLADYAEVLARQANGDFSGKPEELLARALHLDPENEQALALAGIAAYHRQAYPEAVSYLEKLLPKLPPDSEGARTVKGTIEEARKLAGLTASLPQPRAATRATLTTSASGSASALKGHVSLSPALAATVKPGDILFVYAKPVQGPRIPLAVLRTHATALPLAFTLDDSLAMNPQMKLSLLAPGTEVQVGARISRSGEAMPRSGDPVGEINHVKPGTQDLKIVIDHAVP
jgi:cytochrome c-type biogenesis protein CcmH